MTRPASSGRHSATPCRTAATRECVVPRSMPTAMRRWCGSGAPPGSEICSKAMSLLSQCLEPVIDVLGKALNEHEGSDLLGCALDVVALVDRVLQLVERRLLARADLVGERFDIIDGAGLFE